VNSEEKRQGSRKVAYLRVAAILIGAVAPGFGCSKGDGAELVPPAPPFEKHVLEVNAEGKPDTWFGSAMREDIGHIVDYLAIPPDDPRGTFAARGGKKEGDNTRFTFKTPKAGTHVFAFSAMLGKNGTSQARCKSSGEWIDLPLSRIDPGYFRGWDMREWCYWVEIPEGQAETAFEITGGRVGAALIAAPRVDPFEGMPGGKHPMFDVPDVKEWGDTELGRAVLTGAGIGKPPGPLGDDAFEKQKGNLAKYEKMSYYHHVNHSSGWSTAMDGLMYRITGDAKYATLAGMKASRISSWPTWGYVQEWHIDAEEWAAPGFEQFSKWGPFNRNQTLQSSILVEAMAIAYDLAADGMEPADRDAFRKALDHQTHLMYVRSMLSPWNTYHHDNWSGHLLACLGLSGAAMLGENRYAGDWLDRYTTARPHYLADLIDDNGVHREIIHYTCFGLNPLMLAGIAAEKRGEESIFKVAGGRFDKFLRTMVYFASPSGKAMRDFGQGGDDLQVRSHKGLGGREATTLVVMTRGRAGDVARWTAKRGTFHFQDSRGEYSSLNAQAGIMNLLLYKPGPQKSPAAHGGYPLGWHERCPLDYPYDNGYVVMRTGFDSPDDVKMVVKCGTPAAPTANPARGRSCWTPTAISLANRPATTSGAAARRPTTS